MVGDVAVPSMLLSFVFRWVWTVLGLLLVGALLAEGQGTRTGTTDEGEGPHNVGKR